MEEAKDNPPPDINNYVIFFITNSGRVITSGENSLRGVALNFVREGYTDIVSLIDRKKYILEKQRCKEDVEIPCEEEKGRLVFYRVENLGQ